MPSRHRKSRENLGAVPNGAEMGFEGVIDMTTFDAREKFFEQKFVHDEELKFRITAHRNRLLGLWAAEKLGRTGADAEAYAAALVRADLRVPHGDDVFAVIRRDMDTAGVSLSDHQIRHAMDECLAVATDDVRRETAAVE